MCGICGYIGDDRPELLSAMSSSMIHRGPDGGGEWHDHNYRVGLGHRRLSIIDLSEAGRQPMSNEDGSVHITFNGEIYDYVQLRSHLLTKGHVFRSNADTEVLLHLYEERGLDFLSKLNGIFAFALWDSNRRRLVLARDHAGVKPLYYWISGDRLYFASEIKALLKLKDCPRRLNVDALPAYLTLLWVPGKETMLSDIKKLEPGHVLVWENSRAEVRRWFNLPYCPDESIGEHEWAERVYECLVSTMKRQMVADVPLGSFLSGGVDSSALVAAMRALQPEEEITCYTARADRVDCEWESFGDDFPFARRVADDLGLQLKHFDIKPNIMTLLPKMIYHLDEPDADPAVLPSYLIARFARDHGTKVLISGTGGDEVFFGYRSHVAYHYFQMLSQVPAWLASPLLHTAHGVLTAASGAQSPLARRVHKFQRGFSATGIARHIALVDWSDPRTREGLFSRDLGAVLTNSRGVTCAIEPYYNAFEGTGELNRHSFILQQTFLAAHNFLYTDKTSMAASVEVRVPFVDVEMLHLAARIPEKLKFRKGRTKNILKRAVGKMLPPEILTRKKVGFGAPLRKWIACDLEPLIENLLNRGHLSRRGLFDPARVEQILKENRTNNADHAYLIYALLNLEIWQQTFIDSPGQEVTV